MGQVEWQMVKEVLYGAISTPPAARSEFLDSACRGDPELRSRVEVLLGSYESDFLESPLLAYDERPKGRSEPLLEPGRTFSHYTILKLLGRGGMGEVYLANDEKLDRLAAIKIIHGESGFGDQSAARLMREARSVAKLDHPNICSVYEVGETDGQPFIAMQYVEGEMLDTLIQSEAISYSDALSYARQIAAALAKAHSWGIIHRDIKPSNIIVDRRKQVKVLDFGLAKEIWVNPETADISAVGLIAGTLTYMSPEHARGQDIDGQTDIWSLGVVLYQMFTGKLPFKGETKADLIAHLLNSDFEPPSDIERTLPPAVDHIIGRALAKDRLARYGTAEEFDADLADLAETGSVAASRGFVSSHKAVEASMLSRVYSIGLYLMPLVLFAAIAAGGLSIWQGRSSGAAAQPFATNAGSMTVNSLYALKRQMGGAITSLEFSPDSKSIAFTLSGEKGTAIYIQQLSGEAPVRITDESITSFSPVWSPDGERIAYLVQLDGQVAIWSIPAQGGDPTRLVPLKERSTDYLLNKWSRDGRRLFITNIGLPGELDLETGEITSIDLEGIIGKPARDFSVSPDESLIMVTIFDEGKSQLWAKSLITGEVKVADAESDGTRPSLFPDNQTYAYTSARSGKPQIYIRSIDDSTSRPVTFGNFHSTFPVVSPDGQKIVYVSNIDEANVFSTDIYSNRETPVTTDVGMQLFPKYSPDLNAIAYQSVDDGRALTAGRIRIKGGPSSYTEIRGGQPLFSPNGAEIAFVRGETATITGFVAGADGQSETRITTVGIQIPAYRIAPFELFHEFLQWSPDSSKLAFVSRSSGNQNIWSVGRDGSDERMLTDLNDGTVAVTPLWAPDGERLAFIRAKGPAPAYSAENAENEISIYAHGTITAIARFEVPVSLLCWSLTRNGVYVAVLASGKPLHPHFNTFDIYFVSADGSGRVQKVSRLPNARRFGIRISPDQKWIAYTQRRDDVDDLHIVPMGSSEPRRITTNDDSTVFYSGLTWSPDSRTLLYSKQTGGMQISLISHEIQEEN